MTNEQKAARLEEMAVNQDRLSVVLFPADSRKALTDAALLREAAAMMRERGAVQWIGDDRMKLAHYKGRGLMAFRPHRDDIFEDSLWSYVVSEIGGSGVAQRGYPDDPPVNTLEAAQAAAVAWVDEQEGRDV